MSHTHVDTRYRTFRSQLDELFGTRVYRIPVDAGLECPHRDRERKLPGCLYCDSRGSGALFLQPELSVRDQLLTGIDSAKERYHADKFLPYFQAYTNTYADTEFLYKIFTDSLSIPGVVGLAIGTRPDAAPDTTLDMLQSLAASSHIWLEYGMESCHDATLRRMNRQHTYHCLVDTVNRSKDRGLHVCVHIILGLPGETRDDMMETVVAVRELGVEGVKIHSLYIDGTMPLAKDFRAGRLKFMEREEYVELVIDILEMLPEDMVIHRLIGSANRYKLLGPLWTLEKTGILNDIYRRMIERNTRQGAKCTPIVYT